jgi:hypothetical protein
LTNDGTALAVVTVKPPSLGVYVIAFRLGVKLKVRILATPVEDDIEGVRLDLFRPGKVCEVSSSVGAWLIANGYALAEMRRTPSMTEPKAVARDRRRFVRR